MKKFLILLTVIGAASLCDASIPTKETSQSIVTKENDPIKEIQERLSLYAGLSFEEKRGRANEICDYIGMLFDKILESRNRKRSSSGLDIDAQHAGTVIELIKQYLPAITANR